MCTYPSCPTPGIDHFSCIWQNLSKFLGLNALQLHILFGLFNFFDSSITEESFEDKTCVWCTKLLAWYEIQVKTLIGHIFLKVYFIMNMCRKFEFYMTTNFLKTKLKPSLNKNFNPIQDGQKNKQMDGRKTGKHYALLHTN